MSRKKEIFWSLYTLTEKEIRRFMRIWIQTLVPPAVTMSLYFVIFGSLIGPRIGEMDGFDYVQFMIPGLIMMSVITNSYANVVSSFYSVKFQKSILNWYHKDGRKNLPWQQNISAYSVWISEIMLQQTQVVTVIPYYERFMSSFPTVRDLAEATQDVVMEHWAGLGYYSRARNLHQTAKMIISEFQGIFPNEIDDLIKLPGIGRTTAGAIKSLAFNQRGTILDGNVKRVLSRYHKIEGWSGSSKTNKALWFYADKHTPNTHVREYTQAIMDIGATVCKKNNPCCTCLLYTSDAADE